MATEAPVRFGLVGQGGWAEQHARAIQEEGGALAWVVGHAPTPSLQVCEEGVPYVRGFDLGRLPPVDVVDIVVPNAFHADYARQALARGFHVLLEKPMATSVADARSLLDVWRRSSRLLAIGYEMRFSPLWQTVAALLEERLPQWTWLDLSLERHPYRPGRQAWRHRPELVGDWVIEEAVHHIDLLAWLGRRTASAVTVSADFPGTAPPLASLMNTRIAYHEGGMATYRVDLNAEGHHLVFTAYGEAGSLRCEWHGATDRTREPRMSITWRAGGQAEPIPLSIQAGEVFEINREIRAMMAAVRHDAGPLWMTPEEAFWNLATTMAITEAGTAQHPVVLSYPDA